MTDLRAAAEMALEYLEYLNELDIAGLDHEVHTNALRQALAQPEQEPVAWQNKELPMEFYEYEHLDPMWHHHYRPLYTAPPSKPWVSLTDEEIDYIWGVTPPDYENFFEFPRAIEAALRSKNNG